MKRLGIDFGLAITIALGVLVAVFVLGLLRGKRAA